MATKTLKNGAEYDMETKRIVKGATLSSDTARDMVRAREEKRMRLYAEGAQLAVQRGDLIAKYGTDAHLVERAITLQVIASTPDAGKAAVMADSALQKAQGYDTKQAQDGGAAVTLSINSAGVAALLALVAGDVVDGEIVDDDR